MTINYTTLLGLAKPVTGTESGQWGDVVNDQITTLVEDAVANASSISVTAGNVTLTTTTGAANQARMSTLIITGSPGTTRNVVAPSQAKVYVVINQSNAAVVVKGAATTGVTIGAGQTAQIAWNGSDFVEIGNYVHGNFVVNGNLSVNGNSTLGDGGADITTINGQFVGANANISKATTLSTSAPAFFWLEGATYTDTGTAGGTTQPHATFHQIDAPTVNTSNIVTYTNASTLYIAGAPSAAGSATITNPYALFINGGASYFGAAVTMAATTQNLALGTSQTSGTWTAGGAAQTGTLTLDQSTKAHTLNLGTGATENATTKTINIGTAGVSGSTTTINIGSAVSGSTTSVTINGGSTTTGAVTYSATTQNIALGTSQTSGTWTAGGAAQTGTITLDQSTKAHTLNIGTGATESAATKTVNIGTAGVSGSTTNLTYGSGVTGSTTTHIWNSGGTEGMRLNSTGLGIGTNSPGAKLDVSQSQNGQTAVQLTNSNAGASAEATFIANNGTYIGSFGVAGASKSAFGAILASDAYIFSNANVANTGITLMANSANGVIKFATGGSTEKMRLDSSGNLGLGVTPSAWSGIGKTLQVNTGGSFSADAANAYFAANSYYNGTNWIYQTTNNATRYTLASNSHIWYTAPSGTAGNAISFTQAMTLDSSGNLGLGVTPRAWSVGKAFELGGVGSFIFGGGPTQNIVGTNAYYNSGWKYASTGLSTQYEQSAGVHYWFTAPSGTAGNAISFTQAMTLDASGNLLVGATSAELGAGFGNIQIQGSSGAIVQAQTGAGTVKCAISADSSNGYVGTRTNHPLLFTTNNTERARITSGGGLLVGTTSALTGFTQARLTISGTTGFVAQTTAATNEAGAFWNAATAGDNVFVLFGTETTHTLRGTITYNRAGGLTAYNTTSDYRAKDIIGPVQNPGATIDALKVYEGVMKGATQSRPMLIAHEAQEHAPYAVSGVKDEVNEDGTPKFQQMDVSSLVPLLLAEIQSLRARVAALESQP